MLGDAKGQDTDYENDFKAILEDERERVGKITTTASLVECRDYRGFKHRLRHLTRRQSGQELSQHVVA